MSNITSTSFEHAISDGSTEQLSQPNRHANRVRINGRKNPAIPTGILPANHRRVSAEHVEPFLPTGRRIPSISSIQRPAGISTGNDRLPFEPRPKQNQSDLWHHGLTAVEQAFASNYAAFPQPPPPPPLKAGRPKLTVVIPETLMLRDSYAEAQRRLEEGGFTSGNSSTGNFTTNSYGTFNRWDAAQQQVMEASMCVYDTKVYVLKVAVAVAFIFGMGFWFALVGNWN